MSSSSVFLFDNILVLSWVCYHVPYCPLHFSIASLCPSMQLLNALIHLFANHVYSALSVLSLKLNKYWGSKQALASVISSSYIYIYI